MSEWWDKNWPDVLIIGLIIFVIVVAVVTEESFRRRARRCRAEAAVGLKETE
jgi:hypothetical protein